MTHIVEGYPLSIDTLGKLKRNGGGLYACCTARYSGHGAPLDLDALIARYGDDYVFIKDKRIGAACVCTKCGHKGASIIVTACVGQRALEEHAKAVGEGVDRHE